MFCPNCGTKAEAEDRFCAVCGYPLEQENAFSTSVNRQTENPTQNRNWGKSPVQEDPDLEHRERSKRKNSGGSGVWLWVLIAVGIVLIAVILVLLAMIFRKEDAVLSNTETAEHIEVSPEEEEDQMMEAKETEGETEEETEEKPEDAAEVVKEEPVPSLVTDSGDIAQIRQDFWRVGKENILNYWASSTIQQDNGVINPPIYLFDNDDQTNWQEGKEDSGEGEFVSFTFDREYAVSAMTFRLGNWKSDTYYYGNNRPKTLLLEMGGYSWSVTFPDEWKEFAVEFSSPVNAEGLKITLEEVYEGTDWDDTAITEVGVWYQ